MSYALLMFLAMYVGRKLGWLASRRVLYGQSGAQLFLLCAIWGVATALLIRFSINTANPGTLMRWIFGYALGAYIAIPNFGLIAESTIPHDQLSRHRLISNAALFAYVVGSIALTYLAPPVPRETPAQASEISPRKTAGTMPRSVMNFLFGLDALSRADSRPAGIAADSNVHRVAAIFREALDSAASVDPAELNEVFPGLGDHFLDGAVKHMSAIAHVEGTRSDSAMDEAVASIVVWQRWWNANRGPATTAIVARYPK